MDQRINKTHKFIRAFMPLKLLCQLGYAISLMFLLACGGGGGDSAPPTPPPPPPPPAPVLTEKERLQKEYTDLSLNVPDLALFIDEATYIDPGNFTWAEIKSRGGPNNNWALFFIEKHLQTIRNTMNERFKRTNGEEHAMQINSGYRTPLYNQEVGGVSKSSHMYGVAADIQTPDLNDDGHSSIGSDSDWEDKQLLVDLANELGACFIQAYSTKGHIHMDWRNEQPDLVAGGTTCAISGLPGTPPPTQKSSPQKTSNFDLAMKTIQKTESGEQEIDESIIDLFLNAYKPEASVEKRWQLLSVFGQYIQGNFLTQELIKHDDLIEKSLSHFENLNDNRETDLSLKQNLLNALISKLEINDKLQTNSNDNKYIVSQLLPWILDFSYSNTTSIRKKSLVLLATFSDSQLAKQRINDASFQDSNEQVKTFAKQLLENLNKKENP